MMRLSLILILLIAGPALAGINLHLDMSTALPDSFYLDQSTAFKITDHDGDGFYEIQAENDKMFATWSLQYNRTIDYFNKGDNGAGSKYAAAYLDSDTLLDFVEFRNVFNSDDTADNVITVYYSTIHYSAIVSQHIYQPDGGLETTFWYNDCDSLFFADADNDGSLELYCRILYLKTTCIASIFCDGSYAFFNYLIDVNSGTHTTVDWLPYTDYKSLPLFHPDTILNVTVSDISLLSADYKANTSHEYQISRIAGYVDSTLKFSGNAGFEYECQEDNIRQFSLFGPFWIDDIDPATSGYEFATVLDQRSDGWSYDGTTETHCNLGSLYLACYNIAAADQMDTLWKIDIMSQPEIKYIFATKDFPGDLFTVQNNKLYARNASDGQASDSSSEFLAPADAVFAYSSLDTFGDPKLLAVQSGHLNVYDISITTGTDEPPQSILPSSFILGAPYPNPFNPTLSIPVELNSKSHLKIEVFNIAGQKVGQVVDRTIPAGQYKYIWDGSKSASGVYLIKASTDDQSKMVKAVLLK